MNGRFKGAKENPIADGDKVPNLGLLLSLGVAALPLASGNAHAQDPSATGGGGLEQIVVTARRRAENLEDLPMSIAAFTADDLLKQGIRTVEDVGEFVPSVTLQTGDRANHTRVVIRGIGGGSGDVTAAFGSGMYIDGHYIPSSLGGFMSTMDVERIEVLRGPQGTLFGKNVTGGAVNIISTKPGPDFESSLMLRAAEQGEQNARVMANIPLTELSALRIGYAKETFDGYYYNRNLGMDVGATDLSALNTAFRWSPGDWVIDVNLMATRQRDDNAPLQCNNRDGSVPQWGGGAGHLERIYPGATADYKAACDADAAAGTFITSADKRTFSDIDEESVFVAAGWTSPGAVGALDELSVRAKASYRYFDYDYLQDQDGSWFAINAIGSAPSNSRSNGNRTRGTEVLVEGRVNDRLNFTTGVNTFYEYAFVGHQTCRNLFFELGMDDPSSTLEVECAEFSGVHSESLPGPLVNPINFPFLINQGAENEALGVFAHITYSLTDQWELSAGVRWTEDDRSIWNFESATEGCRIQDDPAQRSLGHTSAADTDMCDFTLPISYERIVNDGFFNTQSGTFDATTPMVSITRHLTPRGALTSGNVYFLYSEGFLTGGFNTEVNANLPAAEPLRTYGPEHVKNYEIGFKGTLAGGNVQIMADIFYMDYTDKQETIQIANPDFVYGASDPLSVRRNVASVDISGVEFEMRASAWTNGFVSLDVGYLKNEYGNYVFANPTGPGVIDRTDAVIADLTPDWKVTLGIEHEFSLRNGMTLTPRLNVYAQDDYDYLGSISGAAKSLCNQDAYTKVGTRITLAPATRNWEASLFGNNITDEKIYEHCTRGRGVYLYRHERPANWGVEFVSRWGASR